MYGRQYLIQRFWRKFNMDLYMKFVIEKINQDVSKEKKKLDSCGNPPVKKILL